MRKPAVPYTLVASLAPFAAVNSVVAASTPSAFSRLGVFANGTFTSGDKDATSLEAGFDFKTYGATLGADYRFTDNFILGVTFNYMSTNIDFDSFSFLGSPDGGGIDTQSFGFSIYGTYYVSNQFYVDGIFNFGRNHYDIDRRIIYSIPSTDRTGTLIPGATTTVNQTAQGGTNSTQYSFSVGAGYDFHVQGFTVTPFARLEYSRLDIDGYQESINNTADGFGLGLAFDGQLSNPSSAASALRRPMPSAQASVCCSRKSGPSGGMNSKTMPGLLPPGLSMILHVRRLYSGPIAQTGISLPLGRVCPRHSAVVWQPLCPTRLSSA